MKDEDSCGQNQHGNRRQRFDRRVAYLQVHCKRSKHENGNDRRCRDYQYRKPNRLSPE